MDLIADIVESLALRSQLYFRAELRQPFSIEVPEARDRIRFHVAASGRSWIGLPSGESTFYDTGDLVLVPHGSAHLLASGPAESGEPLDRLIQSEPPIDGILRHGGAGQSVSLVCGHFQLDDALRHPLISTLPRLIHLKAGGGPGFAWMGPLLDAIEAEERIAAPANQAVAQRLSEILFIQVLRAALREPGAALGWLGLVEDPQLGAVLRAVHEDPGGAWSLDRMAMAAGASRSVFAQRFRERLGMSPMRYVADSRVRKARALLTRGDLSVAEVGHRVGYASEAAFSRAFRDAIGVSPGRYRRGVSAHTPGRVIPAARAEIPDERAIPIAS